MKTICLIPLAMLLVAFNIHAQSFIYDQQSATNQLGGGGGGVQEQPMGQSFIPSLSAVGFAQLEFIDSPPNGLGTTVFVNLWSGSISNGTLLATSASVFIPDGAFNLVTNFTFSTPATVTPGMTYYLQPFIQSGDSGLEVVDISSDHYSAGTAIFFGSPDAGKDLWFREGIISVPEPSSSLLILLGSGILIYARRFIH